MILVDANLLIYAVNEATAEHDAARRWLDHDAAWVPGPTERHTRTLGRLLTETRAQGNLVSDAPLAALAIEHGLTLCSTDRDFAAFPGLRWQNPLAPRSSGNR